MDFVEYGNARYIALETFRQNGEGVITPVWVTQEADKLYVWTTDDSWKVKRIRKNSRVRIAESDSRGNPKSDWIEATASVLDAPEDEARQRQRLADKYGFQFHVFNLMYKIRRNTKKQVSIELSAPTMG